MAITTNINVIMVSTINIIIIIIIISIIISIIIIIISGQGRLRRCLVDLGITQVATNQPVLLLAATLLL